MQNSRRPGPPRASAGLRHKPDVAKHTPITMQSSRKPGRPRASASLRGPPRQARWCKPHTIFAMQNSQSLGLCMHTCCTGKHMTAVHVSNHCSIHLGVQGGTRAGNFHCNNCAAFTGLQFLPRGVLDVLATFSAEFLGWHSLENRSCRVWMVLRFSVIST